MNYSAPKSERCTSGGREGKGSDLFDLWYSLTFCDCIPEETVQCFVKYMEHSKRKIGRNDLLANLEDKLSDRRFLGDVPPLIRSGLEYDPQRAFALVSDRVISLINI